MENFSHRMFDWMGRSRFRGKRLLIIAMAALFVVSVPFIFLFIVAPAFVFGFLTRGLSRLGGNDDGGSRRTGMFIAN